MLGLTLAVGSAIAVAACTPAGYRMAESRRLQAVDGGGAHPAWDTQAAAADTMRYTLLPLGVPGGTRSVWWETPQLRLHRLDFRGRVLESRTELDAAGTPLLVETQGIHPRTGAPWEERFERGAESGHFVSLEYGLGFDLPLLVAALLARPDRTLPLLPDGVARLETVGRREVEAEGERRALTHYAIHGLDIAPEYLWLDEDDRLFADRNTVLAGWESVHPELMAASADAVAGHAAAILGGLTPAPRERPLVIRRARLFDPERRTMTPATSIVIRGNRVTAVGPDDSIDVAIDAEVMDAAGRTVLPGLWDLHVHMHEGFIEELDAPLFVAAGVTTVRDLGGDTGLVTSLRDRGVAGAAIAPRILPALIMYGPGSYPWGAAVGTPEEARDAVDRFAALGYVQVKLYNPVPAELVPLIIERARHHGMRVSGHLPNGMTGRDVIDAGFDEIQHLFYARIAAADARLGADTDVAERMAAVRPATEEWRQFVDLLLEHDVVIDASLAVVEETVGGQPPRWLGTVIERFPPRAGRMAARHVGPPGPPALLRDRWDEIVANGPALLKSLYDAGVTLVAGTDAQIGGFELQRELEIYVEAGLPAADVLAMATLGAARVMGMEAELGSIEPGKLADLILVDGDPAEDIRDIRRVVSVVKDGRVYDPAAIYSALGLAPCCGSHRPAVESVQTHEAVAPPPVARALANDHTERAGRMAGSELHIELEAVEAEWFPRGPDGPRIVTHAFAEVGRAPSVPGPLIRAAAGTPVVVTVTNRLERAIQVRGLDGRKSAVARPPRTPPTFPDFFFADSLVIPAGESRTVRFRLDQELTSFYYARTIPPAGVLAPPSAVPGGIADEGAFMGALVMDPPHSAPHEDERVFMITRWGSPAEPGSLDQSWKMMVNGLAWPATERIELTVGDTARWRIINASAVDHPMHLHGFYFIVDGTGDTQADTVFVAQDRREVVTEVMKEYSSLRLRWTPDRPGNWLFHCHLIRHMGELQRFRIDREAGEGGGHDMPDMDGMAGLITGITVQPAPGAALEDPVPVRRIDLWTGRRDGVFADRPELAFVVQDGARPPSPDSTRVPGSPLFLTRGQPTEIVVHNRLDFPLSVHWHGLELRSLYDGVGHWSGEPGMTRPPIPPADSQRVIIEPPRAGTFFYHTHGEPGHELQQGLYGAFLVLDEGESWDRDADRVYVLASRGAQIDAPPSINGQVRPEPEQFQPGRTYRLRFIHISPDEFKRVRLLRDGDAVEWLPLAKDGADLPEHRRAAVRAELGIGVGEAYDFLWTPDRAGIHVLEVRTDSYPNRGGSVTQRQAFAVGEVSESAIRMATTGTDLSMVDLTAEERARYVGTYIGRLEANDDQRDWVFTVWEDDNEGLYSSAAPREDWDSAASYLIPLGDHAFVPGRYEDGLVAATEPDVRIRFGAVGERAGRAEIAGAGGPSLPLQRVGVLTLTEDELLPLVGSYTAPGLPVDVLVQVSDGALSLVFGPGPPAHLVPMSRSRFRIEGPGVPPGTRIRFDLREGRVTGALVTSPGGQLSMPLVRKD